MTRALPAAVAEEVAAEAGVEIALLESVDDLAAADRLLARVWLSQGGLMGVNVLRALSHSGHYVAGAWREGELVGASVAWAWGPERPRALHSHITGIDPQVQGRGVGLALKLHQAAWSLARGIDTVTWTFDPMVRRNGWFNLVKLGARGESFHPDFYGRMSDGVNDGELTDRCFVVWSIPPRPAPPMAVPTAAVPSDAGSTPPGDSAVILTESPGGRPRMTGAAGLEPDRWPGRLLCQVPSDAVDLRRQDPDLGRDWRLALRATMGRAMSAGYAAVSMTPDGFYVLERGPEGDRMPV